MDTVQNISSNIQNPISQMAEAASDLIEPKPRGIFAQFRNNKFVSGLSSTHSANPISCEAGSATLDYLKKDLLHMVNTFEWKK